MEGVVLSISFFTKWADWDREHLPCWEDVTYMVFSSNLCWWLNLRFYGWGTFDNGGIYHVLP